MTDPKNTDLVLAEVQEEPYARRFSADEIERALQSTMEVFANLEHKFVPGLCAVILRPRESFQRPASFAKELIPAFLYAHRYFGDSLPIELRQKLRNQPQTHDTLFELICMGYLQQDHEVRYEPRLGDGKVPDLMLTLNCEQEVYVECKAQSVDLSKHMQLFSDAASEIHSALDTKRSKFVERSWDQGLRVEVRLSQSPSSADIRELQQTVDTHEPSPSFSQAQFGKAITVSLATTDEPFDQALSSPSAVMLVGTTPTQLHHRNARVAVYPWRRLDSIQRKSQRRLLKSARLQLKSIPSDAFGMICIQTFSSNKFAPDVHELIKQDEYARVPIVWMNPIGEGRLIYRDDAYTLKDAIFRGLISRARENRSESAID